MMGRLGFALRETFRQGYHWGDFRADLMAGAVVGVVALPLSMALAVASGVAPQHGLYTAIVGGAVIAVLGGSRGPGLRPHRRLRRGARADRGPSSASAGCSWPRALAGILLFVMGAVGMGQLIEFVPYPVTTGFTAGIAVVIGTLQLKDLLGLTTGALPEHYLERVAGADPRAAHAAPLRPRDRGPDPGPPAAAGRGSVAGSPHRSWP